MTPIGGRKLRKRRLRKKSLKNQIRSFCFGTRRNLSRKEKLLLNPDACFALETERLRRVIAKAMIPELEAKEPIGLFLCESCGEISIATQSEDAAKAEFEANFPQHDIEYGAVVCDGCYQRIMGSIAAAPHN